MAKPVDPALQHLTSEIWAKAAIEATRAAAYFTSKTLPNPATKDFLDQISSIWKSVIDKAIQEESKFISKAEQFLHAAREQDVDHRMPNSPLDTLTKCRSELAEAHEKIRLLRSLITPATTN